MSRTTCLAVLFMYSREDSVSNMWLQLYSRLVPEICLCSCCSNATKLWFYWPNAERTVIYHFKTTADHAVCLGRPNRVELCSSSISFNCTSSLAEARIERKGIWATCILFLSPRRQCFQAQQSLRSLPPLAFFLFNPAARVNSHPFPHTFVL